jgi:hypothetical protein
LAWFGLALAVIVEACSLPMTMLLFARAIHREGFPGDVTTQIGYVAVMVLAAAIHIGAARSAWLAHHGHAEGSGSHTRGEARRQFRVFVVAATVLTAFVGPLSWGGPVIATFTTGAMIGAVGPLTMYLMLGLFTSAARPSEDARRVHVLSENDRDVEAVTSQPD